ncbi:MAG: S8 family serine peptidase [Bacteroidetes bacterium]|nr:S8 family serine peptidase [Bacteroidota bacterium]
MDPALQEEILPTLNANEFIEAMVRLKTPDQIPAGINVVARFGDIFTCRVQRGLVNQVYNHPNVRSFKAARVFSHSHFLPDQFQDFTEVPENNYMSFDASDSVTESSEVIIGILDWGCDFAHHDFINPDGTSRIIALWDQSKSISGKIPQPYNYGSVHSHADINRAISTAQPYHMLQYHPSIADNGHGAHGTHVIGIAAANGRSGTQGVCPNAKIIFVHLATIDTAGNYNLGDSVRLLEALDFVKRTAGDRPCVINLSVGKHGGPHDGTTLVEQAMDNMLDPSRNFAICQSAGNYFNDNIHAGGFIKPLTTHQIDFYIDRADTTQNELEVWYNSKDKFVFKIVTPGNVTAECIINSSREVILNNTVIGRMYHRSNEPNNGKNHFEIFLYTNAPPGEWKLLITPVKLLDGRFDAWIERDNACDTCQSRFLLTSNSTLATTNTICNGYNTIVTGAYNSRVQPFALTTFSSSGPTIDGRIRPLLIAPGHQISSSKSSPRGSNTGSNAVTLMSGTSMASPRVAGTVALILSKFGQRPQPFFVIRDILLSSCTEVNLPPHFHRVGYGLLNQQNAINKANEILRLAIVNSNSSGDNKESLKLNLKSTPQLQLPTSHTCSCQKHNQDNTIPFLEMMDSGPVPSFENVSLEQLDAATGTIKNAINRLVPSFHDTTFYNTSSAAITYSPLEQFTLNNLISNTRKYNSAKNIFL